MHRRPNLSIEHEVMVSKIAERLNLTGIKCYIFDRPNGPDIVAYHGLARIAIEYETGRKAIEESKAMIESRADKFDRVIVIVNETHLPYYQKTMEGCEFIGSSAIPDIAKAIGIDTQKINPKIVP